MKETENKDRKAVTRVTEGTPGDASANPIEVPQTGMERLKKPLIFGLMGVVFFSCMYLIFSPSSDKKESQQIGLGLNDDVPQASNVGLQADKQRAYELELFEQRQEEKRAALMDLSDYWNMDSSETAHPDMEEPEQEVIGATYGNRRGTTNPALNSYHNMQSSLGTFYQSNDENETLRRELEELKEQLAHREATPENTLDSHLELMEKSYQMAARYFPSTSDTGDAVDTVDNAASTSSTQKESFVAVLPTGNGVVSALYREPTHTEFLTSWAVDRNLGFHTVGKPDEAIQPRNSIRACVHETQTVTVESNVRLRLLETARTPNHTIPKGTLLTATARFQNGRLQLQVVSIETDGNIIPVDITIYDLDGQQGLYVPYSPEMNAFNEMAANMGSTAGTNIMLTSSAGQQIAADLSRGVVQGLSGYFSKKARAPKITLKAGHRLYLISKN